MPDQPSTARRFSPNVEGALWMLLSAVTFVAMTTLVKYMGEDFPAQVQNFYRQLATLVFVLPFILRNPVGVLRTSRPGVMLFRAGAGTVGLILMFYSYQHLPLADANALSFTRPLWVVLLAALVLRETLGAHRIIAVAAGFVGVLIILRPGAPGAFGPPQLAALGSSFLTALTITGMKSLSRDHAAMSLLAWSAILGVLFSIPFAFFGWRWPTPHELILLAAMGALGVINQGVFIKGMSIGDAAALAPLDYTRLIFSIIAGFVLFGDVPDGFTLGGSAVIVASTLYITWREVQASRKARAAAALGPEA